MQRRRKGPPLRTEGYGFGVGDPKVRLHVLKCKAESPAPKAQSRRPGAARYSPLPGFHASVTSRTSTAPRFGLISIVSRTTEPVFAVK